MIKVWFNPKQFPNTRIGISEAYDTLDGPVEFIASDENYIEYDTEQELMDFYANIDCYFMDDIDELFCKEIDDDMEYPIEDRVGHFFDVRIC